VGDEGLGHEPAGDGVQREEGRGPDDHAPGSVETEAGADGLVDDLAGAR
jgi:hypothetical protein